MTHATRIVAAVAVLVALAASVPVQAQLAEIFRADAEQGVASAQFNLGRAYATGEGVPQDAGEAVRWWRLAAEQGDASAQSALGVMYANGRGVPQDFAEAVRWYRLAAEQGNVNAQTNLGVYYFNGQGVSQDDTAAVQWWRLAAEQDHAVAMSNLGAAYSAGRGVVQDDVQAYKWLDLAASRPSGENREQAIRARDDIASRMTPEQITEAQRLARERDTEVALRERTEREAEVQREERRALAETEAELEEQRALAERGGVFDQLLLGLMLRDGRYAPKDEVESAHWLRRASNQGMVMAQYALGQLLAFNSSTAPLHASPISPERLERMTISERISAQRELEESEAVRWFRLAADGGHPLALIALADSYYNGKGVPADYVQAYVWGSIAANNLNPGHDRDVTIQLKDEAASRLTADQKAEGDRLVQEWSETHETRYDLPGMLPPPPPR